MAAFVRFVFTILIVGMVINLAIVLAANARSQRRQRAEFAVNAQHFSDLLAEVNGRSRRADIIVDSQRFDGDRHVTETTLLVRQYHILAYVKLYNTQTGRLVRTGWQHGTSLDWPLPVVRIVIPGNRLQVNGLIMKFGPGFAAEGGDYSMLSNAQLAFFGRICGADETAPTGPNAVDERFSYLVRDEVPELVRLDTQAQGEPNADATTEPKALRFLVRPQASYFELNLWQVLWPQIPDMPEAGATPQVPGNSGFTATWTKPATISLQLERTYSAFIGPEDGQVTLTEDLPGISGLRKEIKEEWEAQNSQ